MDQISCISLIPGFSLSTENSEPRPRVSKKSSNSVLCLPHELHIKTGNADRDVNGSRVSRVSVSNHVDSSSLATLPEEASDQSFLTAERNGSSFRVPVKISRHGGARMEQPAKDAV